MREEERERRRWRCGGEEEEEERIRVCKEGMSCDGRSPLFTRAHPTSPFFELFTTKLFIKDIRKETSSFVSACVLFSGAQVINQRYDGHPLNPGNCRKLPRRLSCRDNAEFSDVTKNPLMSERSIYRISDEKVHLQSHACIRSGGHRHRMLTSRHSQHVRRGC